MTEPTTLGISEGKFQKQITDLADLTGWKWMHISDSRQQRGGRFVGDDLCTGWPDLTLVHVERRLTLFWELKVGTPTSKRGRPTLEQAEWLGALTAAGQRAEVLRPADWDYIEEVLRG